MTAPHPFPTRAQFQGTWKFKGYSYLAKETFTFSKFWSLAMGES